LKYLGAVHIQPQATAPVFGTLKAGSRTARTGQFKSFSRVALGDGRVGYVETDALGDSKDATSARTSSATRQALACSRRTPQSSAAC
jgi:hypothetical protein